MRHSEAIDRSRSCQKLIQRNKSKTPEEKKAGEVVSIDPPAADVGERAAVDDVSSAGLHRSWFSFTCS